MGAERSQWQFPANEVGKVIGWSDEASPSNPNASKGLVNKGPFLATADVSNDPDLSVDGDKIPTRESVKAYADTKAALNVDGGLSLNITATPTLPIDTAFGGTWLAANHFTTTDTTPSSSNRATAVISRVTAGSEAVATDYALHLETRKTDYLTSVTAGFIDAMQVVVRTNSVDDAGAILVNIHAVEGRTTGGTTAFEAATSIVDSSGVKTREFKVTLGGQIYNAGDPTDLRIGGFGFMTRPNLDGHSYAHGVLVLGLSGVAGTGIVTAIECSATLSSSQTYFAVTGDEHADGSGRVRASSGSVLFPTFSFVSDRNSGIYSLGVGGIGFATVGTVRMLVGPGVRVGAGMSDQGAGTLNVLTSIHVNNTKVVGARDTGWAAMTGTANEATVYDTASVTLPQLAGRVMALQAALTTHGLIGA